MSPTIRRVRPGEWQRLRELRLRALADAPTAFADTLAAAEARPDADWQDRAREQSDRVTFIAERDDRWTAMATGISFDTDRETPHLVGMFVDASERGSGLGAALVEQVCDWARRRGWNRIALWVNVENESALALYRRCGFEPTGEQQPIAHTPGLMELRMVRRL